MNLKNIKHYECKSKLIPGSSYAAINKIARKIFNEIKSKTKRRPYIRSAFFKKEKIFLDNFWPHLKQKNLSDQKRRLRFFECAIELIQKSKNKPFIKNNYKGNEIFYRFCGLSNGRYFIVQIKEDGKRNQKFLMSIFDYNKK